METMEFSPTELMRWANFLEGYAHDWDSTFEHRPSYYTQEFWYLFVSCLSHSWRGSPMTMNEACNCMKLGSQRTREERIKKAVIDGYLQKSKHSHDGREILLLPTDKLQTLVVGHLQRTLKHALHTLESLEQPAHDLTRSLTPIS